MILKIALLTFLIISLALPAMAENYTENYTVSLDREFGFWAVRSDNFDRPIVYNGHTLNIHTGDSVIWLNTDSVGDRVTIVSDNMLWEGGKILGGPGKKFRLTFNSSSLYQFHMVETNRWISNKTQPYEYNTTDEDTGIESTVVTTSDVPYYENYNYHYMRIAVSGEKVGDGTYPITWKQSGQTIKSVKAGNDSDQNRQATMEYIVNTGVATPVPIQVSSISEKTVKNESIQVPVLMESYQEFTLYEIIKRWINIIQGIGSFDSMMS